MKRLVTSGLVLAAGLGFSACGSSSHTTTDTTPHTQSYKDGWNMAVLTNHGDMRYYVGHCNHIYDLDSLPSDLRSEFIAGCKDAGKTLKTYNSTH